MREQRSTAESRARVRAKKEARAAEKLRRKVARWKARHAPSGRAEA